MNRVKVVTPTDDRQVIFGAGDEYFYLATGKDTDGQYFFFESVVPPGGGPPAHVQTKEEEAFYILSGTVTFYAEGQEAIATPGTYLNVPKGVRHRFRNNTAESARMLVFFAPAGIEDMFSEMGEQEAQFAQHPKGVIHALNEVGYRYGVKFFPEDE